MRAPGSEGKWHIIHVGHVSMGKLTVDARPEHQWPSFHSRMLLSGPGRRGRGGSQPRQGRLVMVGMEIQAGGVVRQPNPSTVSDGRALRAVAA